MHQKKRLQSKAAAVSASSYPLYCLTSYGALGLFCVGYILILHYTTTSFKGKRSKKDSVVALWKKNAPPHLPVLEIDFGPPTAKSRNLKF